MYRGRTWIGQRVLRVVSLLSKHRLSGLLGRGFVFTSCALQGCHGDRASGTGNGDSLSRVQGPLFFLMSGTGL